MTLIWFSAEKSRRYFFCEKVANMNEYYRYLDKLRKSGVINMMGASVYLQRDFGLSRIEARTVLKSWM